MAVRRNGAKEGAGALLAGPAGARSMMRRRYCSLDGRAFRPAAAAVAGGRRTKAFRSGGLAACRSVGLAAWRPVGLAACRPDRPTVPLAARAGRR